MTVKCLKCGKENSGYSKVAADPDRYRYSDCGCPVPTVGEMVPDPTAGCGTWDALGKVNG